MRPKRERRDLLLLCVVTGCPTSIAALSKRLIDLTINADHKSSLLSRPAGWCSRYGPRVDDSVHVAAAACLNEAEPRPLAGRWPHAVTPLGDK
jgi:hypothetical protein